MGPRTLLVASVGSAVGKTTICAALTACLRGAGVTSVRAFAVVPDVPDQASRLLDDVLPLNPWLLGGTQDKLQQFVLKHSHGCDVVLIDGCMGLHTPLAAGTPAAHTTASVATQLKAHTILLVDGGQPLTSLISAVKVSLETCPALMAPCLVLNQVDPASCMFNPGSLQAALQAAGLPIRLVGCIPSIRGVPADSLPGIIRRHIDIDAVLHACPPSRIPVNTSPSLKRLLGALPGNLGSGGGATSVHAAHAGSMTEMENHAGSRAVIAVAVDEVFGPAYPGDLATLRAEGASLQFFSPLRDVALPPGCQGVLLGGTGDALAQHMHALSHNSSMRQALLGFCRAGGVVLAQSAGVVYLSTTCSADGSNEHAHMVGVFPFRAELYPTSWPPSQGFVELVPSTSTKVLLTTHPASTRASSASGTTAATTHNIGPIRALLHTRAELLEERSHRLGPWGGPPPHTHAPAARAYSTAFYATAASSGAGNGTNASRPSSITQSGDLDDACACVPASPGGNANGTVLAGSQSTWTAGYVVNNVLASTMVWPLSATPEFTHGWVAACARVDAAAVHPVVQAVVAAVGNGGAGKAGLVGSGGVENGAIKAVGCVPSPTKATAATAVDGKLQLVVGNSETVLLGGKGTGAIGNGQSVPGEGIDAPAGNTLKKVHMDSSQHALNDSSLRPSVHMSIHASANGLAKSSPARSGMSLPPPSAPSSRGSSVHGGTPAPPHQPPHPSPHPDTSHPLTLQPPFLQPHSHLNPAAATARVSLDSHLAIKHLPASRSSTCHKSTMHGRNGSSAMLPTGPGTVPTHPTGGSLVPSRPLHRRASQPSISAASSPGPVVPTHLPNGAPAASTFRAQMLGSGAAIGLAMARPGSCMELAPTSSPQHQLQHQQHVPSRRSLCDWQQTQGWGYDSHRMQLQYPSSTGTMTPAELSVHTTQGQAGHAAMVSSLVDSALGLPALSQLTAVASAAGNSTGRGAHGGHGAGKLIGLACPLRPGSAPATASVPREVGAAHGHPNSVHSIKECEEGPLGSTGSSYNASGWLSGTCAAVLYPVQSRPNMSRAPSGTLSVGGRSSFDAHAPPAAMVRQRPATQGAHGGVTSMLGPKNAPSRSTSSGSLAVDGSHNTHVVGQAAAAVHALQAASGAMVGSCQAGMLQPQYLMAPASRQSLQMHMPHGSSGGFGALHGPGWQGMDSAGAPFWLRHPTCSDGIVSFCPGATEVLAAIGLAGRLVGVTDSCDYPPQLKGTTPLACRNRASLLMSGQHHGSGTSMTWGHHDRGGRDVDGQSQLVVDEDLLREERPSLVVLPDLTRLPATDQHTLTRALHRTLPLAHTQATAAAGSVGSTPAATAGALVLLHTAPTLSEMIDSVLKIGEAAGAPQVAGSLADRLRARLRRVAAATAAAPGTPPRVLVVSCVRVDGSMLQCGMCVPELLAVAGARQAVSESGAVLAGGDGSGKRATVQLTPGLQVALEPGEEGRLITWDDVLSLAPDVLIIAHSHTNQRDSHPPHSSSGSQVSGTDNDSLAAVAGLAGRVGWWTLPCVRSGSVFLVDAPLLIRPGPRLVDGSEVLASITHYHRHLHTDTASMHGGSVPPISQQASAASQAAMLAVAAAGLPRLPAGSVLKLCLYGGQRCRPSLLPNYLLPWPPGMSLPGASSQMLSNMWL